MSGLSVEMNVFKQMISALTAAPNNMTPMTAEALVSQIVAIGNLSSIFSAEMIAFNANGKINIGATSSNADQNTGDFIQANPNTGAGPIINIPTVLDFSNNYVGVTYSAGGVTTQELSQAEQIVGTIAHELGHYEDSEYQGINSKNSASYLDPNVSINQALYAGIGLLGEGKALANQIVIAEQIADNKSATSSALVLVEPGGNDLLAEQQFLAANSIPVSENATTTPVSTGALPASLLGTLATYYVNNSVTSAPNNPAYIPFYLGGWGGTKDPYLYVNGNVSGSLKPITSVKIVSTSNDLLQDIYIYWTLPTGGQITPTTAALTIYDLPGDWREDFSSTTPSPATLIDWYVKPINGVTNLKISSEDLDVSGSGGQISDLPLLAPASGYSNDVFVADADSEGGSDVACDSDTQDIALSESNTFVLIDDPANFTGTISNFLAGDTIDLAGVTATGATLGANNVLTVQESGGGSLGLNLDPTENYLVDGFVTTADGHGGTNITITDELLVTLNDVQFEDGRVATGSFVFDTAISHILSSTVTLGGVLLGDTSDADFSYVQFDSTQVDSTGPDTFISLVDNNDPADTDAFRGVEFSFPNFMDGAGFRYNLVLGKLGAQFISIAFDEICYMVTPGYLTVTAVSSPVSVSTFQNDESAPNEDNLPVSDTASNIVNGLPALKSNANAIVSITSSDGLVTVDMGQFTADQAVLNKIVGGFAISDTAANVAAQFDALDADVANIAQFDALDPNVANIRSITLTDSTPVLQLTEAQAAHEDLIADILGSFYIYVHDASGSLLDKEFVSPATGQPYSSYQYIFSPGNEFIGSKFFYTHVTDKPYASYEYDYDGGGDVTRVAFAGVTGAPYSSYEYDYVGGVFAGEEFTYTTVPGGAYAFYEVDYDNNSNFTGDKFFSFFVPGYAYAGEEEDFDADGNLSRVLLTGVTGQAYSSLELDYNAGAYTGYKGYYTGITGQAYTYEEVDVSASSQIEKVVYSGLTGTPYQTVEQDFSSGSLDELIYGFTDVTGQTYNAYQVMENAAGAGLQQIFDLNSGGHVLIALTGHQTLTSLGEDNMEGSGATTFILDTIYGADTITNFGSGDIISLSTVEFGQLDTAIQNGNYAGGNATLTFSDGDVLTLVGVSKTMLTSLSANFTSHA